MSAARRTWITILALFSACGSAFAQTPDPSQIDRAVARARDYILAQVGDDGKCREEFDEDNPRFGGRTALCAYALLAAGADPKNETLSAAMKWLTEAELNGVYAVAMRANALAAFPDRRVVGFLQRDAKWLIDAAAADGAYTYTSAGGARLEKWDNSNTQMAALGVFSAMSRGVDVPLQYWRRMERFWVAQQQPDGSWGYRLVEGARNTKTYGSMTAAGLATLYACSEILSREDFVRCSASQDNQPITDALAWIEKNYDIAENPKLGDNWYYYWLYSLQRVALASGRRYFGSHDWYAEGARELLRRQNRDGSWGFGGDRLAQTAFAAVFLARGRDPVLLNKLQYAGKWNPRPRDCANFAKWYADEFERPVKWQVLSADAPGAHFHDGVVLYISGAGAVDFSKEQVEKLRRFVLEGGVILSEAACNDGEFTLDVIRLYKRLFPGRSLERLPEEHPLYNIGRDIDGMQGLSAVSNGVRLLAIHSPRELSLALQRGHGKERMKPFHLLANVCLLVSDKGQYRRRVGKAWPKAKKYKPKVEINLARIKHDGNCDPEPLAWNRLAILMGNRHRIRLNVSEPVDPVKLDATRTRVAAMTGTEAFTLSEEQSAGLKKFLADGGSLYIDAGGGSKEFAESVRKQIYPLVPDAVRGPVASNVLFGGPTDIRKVSYRRGYALMLGGDADRPQFEGVLSGDRLAVVFSPDDITAGLVGYPWSTLRGLSTGSAVNITINVLCRLANVKLK